jgi:hypothetical protein
VPLTAKAICTWLVSLPQKFPNAIFVMFAASYDWTQIFRDMPYEKAWELWNGLPWEEHTTPTGLRSNPRRLVLWGGFGLRFYPGKYLEIAKFRDPEKIKNDKGKFDFESQIKIYDTFGFFQSSFLKAASGFGGHFLQADERDILESGKARRVDFANVPFDEIKRYTRVELRVTARMMTHMRDALKGYDLALRNWHGAGCIAQAMMKADRITDYYPEISAEIDVDDFAEPLAWALRAYFGGRVEMIKQGVHRPKFWNYDISSAYPHIMRHLPNMKNGEWREHDGEQFLTRGDTGQPISKFRRSKLDLQQISSALAGFSLVSMVRVQFYFPACHRHVVSAGRSIVAHADLPWFPLPIRAEDGTIYFPRHGNGIYMVEEVRAMLRWATLLYEDANDDERPMIAISGAIEFVPVNGAKPFKIRVENGFKERASVIRETERAKLEWEAGGKIGPEPYDVREKVLKLGQNSLYGKTAQSKGMRLVRDPEGVMRAKPPKYSNMFFAAAVTAGARAMLLDNASGDVDAVILFATDGICSTRELPGLEISQTKTLGEWEESLRQSGVFVKAGIYSHEPFQPSDTGVSAGPQTERRTAKRTTRMRGIRPASLPAGMTAEQWLVSEVPQAWERDDRSLEFPYFAYKTVGAALASREAWKLAGHWVKGIRQADIQRVSVKRDCRGVARVTKEVDGPRGERRRAIALFDTAAAENPIDWQLSHAYCPDWLDKDLEKRFHADEERKTLECKGGFGGGDATGDVCST